MNSTDGTPRIARSSILHGISIFPDLDVDIVLHKRNIQISTTDISSATSKDQRRLSEVDFQTKERGLEVWKCGAPNTAHISV